MPDWKIEVGDLVKVNCESGQTTIAHEATVLYIPTATNHPWQFQRKDGTLIYISEGITVYLLSKAENEAAYWAKKENETQLNF